MNSESLNLLDDETLMSRLAGGKMSMLGELYARHNHLVMSALKRFAPELPLAEMEELTQDVFMVVHGASKKYESKMRFKAYLYGIAVKKAGSWRRNTWLRRKLLNAATPDQMPMGRPAEDCPSDRLAFREVIQETLDRLPQKQRDVLLLYAVEGFNREEIAAILSISPRTVGTRIFRARQTLLGNVNRDTWVQVLRKEAS